MPNIKAAEKWMRQTEKRTTRNKDVKTRLKTIFKKAVGSQDAQDAQSVESAFDKAAKSGIIHPNKAARKKSRLAKAMTRAAAAPQAAKKTSGKARAKKTTKKK
ncbi:MAG TPA: 30S ribosomal protein S20 [Candidatus Baltobacteraceae bacterium]|nr:30S ribosomal protein S20 [Candidatus Baltobacteraceae bacterium]